MAHLTKYRSLATCSISFTVAAGSQIKAEAQKLYQEQRTADNIKDKRNRQNVVTALKMIQEKLSLYKETPANGLAIFASAECYV